MDDVACRSYYDGGAHAAFTDAVDVEEIALVDRGICPGDRQFHVAIDGVRHGWVEYHLRTHGGERPAGFGKPHVVADRHPEPAGVRDVENQELFPGFDTDFVRAKRKHLAVAPHDMAARIDDRRGVE